MYRKHYSYRSLLPLALGLNLFLTVAGTMPGLVSSMEKLEITQDAYPHWRSITQPMLSPDGKWVIYTIGSTAGEGEIIARSTQSKHEWRVSRGVHQARFENGTRSKGREPVRITQDSRFAAFTIEAAGEAGLSAPGQVATSPWTLGILDLANGAITRIPCVSSFDVAASSVIYLTSIHPGTNRKTADEAEATQRACALAESRGTASVLVLKDLNQKHELYVNNVVDFVLDEHGHYLAYIVESSSLSGNAVFTRRLHDGRITMLSKASSRYESLTFDRLGTQVAFLARDHDSASLFTIYYSPSPMSLAEPIVRSQEFNENARISPSAGLRFASSGDALIFGVESTQAPKHLRQPSGRDRVTLELWNWKDAWLRPMESVLIEREPPKPYVAVHHFAGKRWAQLGEGSIQTVLLTDDARHAVGIDYSPYQKDRVWGKTAADLYLIDGISGRHKLLRQRFETGEWAIGRSKTFALSPNGKFLLYFENRRWFSYDLQRNKALDLTGRLLPYVSFSAEGRSGASRHETAIGIAGWIDRERVLVYSVYDVWELDLSGFTSPRAITDRVGQKQGIVLRIWPHDWTFDTSAGNDEWLHIDRDANLLLTAHDVDTATSGFWHVQTKRSGPPAPVLMVDKKLTLIAQSLGGSHQYLMRQESFNEFPDLWAGQQLDRLQRISDANPQQREYKWGSAELVAWTNKYGVPLKGVLYKPDGFTPLKRYPMVVHANGMAHHRRHHYQVPTARANATVVPAVYVSKGYLVFKPGSTPVTPYPGESVLASVTSGVQAVIDLGYVDSSRICLVGHSWSSYETTYIITHTDMFRCAVASAGMTNSISDYGSVQRTGGSRVYNYENQGFHGSSIWENPFVYLANSPVMFADRVRTPLLMMHNDGDEIVPFAQAVELYIAMRRNAKEVYLLNYKNEGHNLNGTVNKLDWDRRMQQYIDYFLLRAERPDWMNVAAE